MFLIQKSVIFDPAEFFSMFFVFKSMCIGFFPDFFFFFLLQLDRPC